MIERVTKRRTRPFSNRPIGVSPSEICMMIKKSNAGNA